MKDWYSVSRRYRNPILALRKTSRNLWEGECLLYQFLVLYISVFGGGSAFQESYRQHLCTFAVFPVFIRGSQGNPTSHSSYDDLWYIPCFLDSSWSICRKIMVLWNMLIQIFWTYVWFAYFNHIIAKNELKVVSKIESGLSIM